MSVKGYFESIIDIWKKQDKITPAMKKDMKVVLEQFNNTLYYGELTQDEYGALKQQFDTIYKEVYK